MKQLDLTAELTAQIQAAVGPDVSTEGFAVFEAIAVNSRPLPGKKGTIFEAATISPMTLGQMADSINNGNHLPLILDHDLSGVPRGRVFAADTGYAADGSVELRTLFYIDPTEAQLAAKVNAGSLDEVSVKFLSSQLLCSECGWDYFGADATATNIYTHTCSNDHTVGQDGVHVLLVGLNQFVELSLVARGAADQAKIVGKSASKLQPAGLKLAARGFEVDSVVCCASLGEDVVNFDPSTLITELSSTKATVIALTTDKTGLEAQLTAANAAVTDAGTQVVALTAQVDSLTADLATATALPNNETDYLAALAFLQDVYGKVLVASGAEIPATLPATVAELTAAITEKTNNLTAILPVGGVALGAGNDTSGEPALIASAYTNRKLSK